MSLPAFEDFLYGAVLLDWDAEREAFAAELIDRFGDAKVHEDAPGNAARASGQAAAPARSWSLWETWSPRWRSSCARWPPARASG